MQNSASVGNTPPGWQPGEVIGDRSGDAPAHPLAAQCSDLRAQRDTLQRRYIEAAGRYHWALAVGAELARCPRGLVGFLLQCLPHGLWRWYQLRQLRRKRLFDVRAYSRRYPDTKRSRFGPLAHFLRWGALDGRMGGPDGSGWRGSALPVDAVARILRSGLFDYAWYCDTHGFSGTPEQAVEHYLRESANDPLHNPGPLFSGSHYIVQNPDTVQVNPLWHFLSSGGSEGRRAFSAEAADEFMRSALSQDLVSIDTLLDMDKPTIILTWKDGNFFFNDIADYLSEYLTDRGYRVARGHGDEAIGADTHNIVVVAPHEYCIHGPGRKWPAALQASAIYVNTEQWHTSWFSLAFSVIARSGNALDINPASARGLSKLGFATGFLPIIPRSGGTFAFPNLPLSDQAARLRAVKPLGYPADLRDRAYDVLYVAAMNERRARNLARLSPVLARYDCFLHTPALRGPVKSTSPNMLASVDLVQLARNAKILLNIHQGESRYFEWHRLFLSGIWEGCVVVTEPCIDTGVLRAGDHYLEVEVDLMGGYLEWLLNSGEGQARMAAVHANCLDLRQRIQDGSVLIA